MFFHQVCREFGCAIKSSGLAIATMLAHFDADAILVSWSIVISMVALLGGRHVLNGDTVLNGEMPNDATQGPIVKGPGMSIGITRVVLGAVDGDVARSHGAKSPGHEITPKIYLAKHAGITCPSTSRRTVRQRRP